MGEKVLVTNICPALEETDQELINDRFREELKKSDRLEISVGFCSNKSLKELEELIFQMNIKKVCVILGMYYFDGIPKALHKLALEINEKWLKAGIGEIRLVHAWKYHVKLYCFFKNNQIFSAIFGSPNLSFLTERPVNDKAQKEMAVLINDPKKLKNFSKYLAYLKSKKISENIEILEKYKLKTKLKRRKKSKKTRKISKIIYKKFSGDDVISWRNRRSRSS